MNLNASIILIAIFLTSCSGYTNKDITKFQTEIPTYDNGNTDVFYRLIQQKTKQLSLDTLQNGFDSIQIRIWTTCSEPEYSHLTVIKRLNSTWTATEYILTDWNPSANDGVVKTLKIRKLNPYDINDTVETIKIKNLTPKSGWDNFLVKLFDLQITTLPNMRSIPELVDNWSDECTNSIEIATKDRYRFYNYHCPQNFQDKYWQAKNMVDIKKLIVTELY